MNQGMFVILNGGDGSGKGTQKEKLLELYPDAIQIREPGGTPEAEKIRKALLEQELSTQQRIEIIDFLLKENQVGVLCRKLLVQAYKELSQHGLTGMAEAYLFAASRAESNQKVVIPALQQGKVVLGDRSVACSMAYQGKARQLGMETVWNINKEAILGAYPHIEIYLDLPLEVSQKRLKGRVEKQDRIDLESSHFHQNVKEGYKEYYERYCPYPFEIIDARGTVEEVHQKVRKVLEQYI